jgi:hypothetical protein
MASEQWQDLEGIVRLATWAATLRLPRRSTWSTTVPSIRDRMLRL